MLKEKGGFREKFAGLRSHGGKEKSPRNEEGHVLGKGNIAPIVHPTGQGESLSGDSDKNEHSAHLGKVTCGRSIKNMKNWGNKAEIMDGNSGETKYYAGKAKPFTFLIHTIKFTF